MDGKRGTMEAEESHVHVLRGFWWHTGYGYDAIGPTPAMCASALYTWHTRDCSQLSRPLAWFLVVGVKEELEWDGHKVRVLVEGLVPMNLLADALKGIAIVATGVGIVAAECGARGVGLGDLGPLAIRSLTLKGFGRGRTSGAMDSDSVECRGGRTTEERSGGAAQRVAPQPEDLFAPHKAAESNEARPFQSVESDAGVEPVSHKVALPSVDAHNPPPT